MAHRAGPPSESAREQLLRELALYHQRKAHPMTVVFDGWQHGCGVEHQEFRAGVEVRFSKRGQKADQVIQRLAEACGKDCAVVSSDREVAAFARGAGAFVMSAEEFESRLRDRSSSPSTRRVRHRTDEEEGAAPRRMDKKGNPKKLPKAVRKRVRTLKGF